MWIQLKDTFRRVALIALMLTVLQLPSAPSAAAQGIAPISGTITWADHQPASNVVLDLLPNGPGDIWGWGWNGASITVRTASDGSYSAAACPCSSLMGYLQVGSPGGDLDCQIIMAAIVPGTTQADVNSYRVFNGLAADAGSHIDWIISKARCNRFASGVQPGNVDLNYFRNMNSRESIAEGDSPMSWEQARQWFGTH